jgi:hypothetical protein
MKIEFELAEFRHVVQLMPRLREREKADHLKAYGVLSEKDVLKEVTSSLVAWAGLLDGECGAIWGIKTPRIMGDEGYLWMIGSYLIEEHPVAFLRHSRRALAEVRGVFRRIHGVVLTDFDKSCKWLEWLGFELGPDKGGIRVFSNG